MQRRRCAYGVVQCRAQARAWAGQPGKGPRGEAHREREVRRLGSREEKMELCAGRGRGVLGQGCGVLTREKVGANIVGLRLTGGSRQGRAGRRDTAHRNTALFMLTDRCLVRRTVNWSFCTRPCRYNGCNSLRCRPRPGPSSSSSSSHERGTYIQRGDGGGPLSVVFNDPGKWLASWHVCAVSPD